MPDRTAGPTTRKGTVTSMADPWVVHPEQARDLAAQVDYARRASPLYRRLLGDGPAARFATLDDYAQAVPAITKPEIIANQQAAPPYGDLLAADLDDVVRCYVYPAGQTLAWTAADQRRQEEMYADGLRTSGLTRSDVVDITFQFGWVVAGTIWDAGARRLGATVVPGGAGEAARHAHNAHLLRVTSLIGFSTFLERIAGAAREAGLDPATDLAVRHVLIVGEWHGSTAKQRLSETFGGAQVREAYGTGESGLVAVECAADPRGMHVHPDALLEVRDETGALVADGDGGEIYLTPLATRGMPVLRFRTGDLTESVRHGECGCGRATPRIGPIVGRASELLRVKGSFLSKPLLRGLIDEAAPGGGEFHVTVSRPRGMDDIQMELEVPDPDRFGSEPVARTIRARAGVLVQVVPVPRGTLTDRTNWYTDRRG